MAEPRDDKVSAAFRALPPVEPPPALDDAIRAAARRAVKAKPDSPLRRWALPASVAAVLALSVGIALHVDWQKPLVVDGTPVSAGSAEYPVSQAPSEAPAVTEPPRTGPAAKDSAGTAPSAKVSPAEPVGERREEKRAAPLEAASPPPASANLAAPAAPPAAPLSTAPAPAAMQAVPARAAADTAAAPPSASSAPAPAAVAPMRAKREAAGASLAKEAFAVPPEKQLERVAELRAAGRHDEADEALANFRREHPDYRIPPEIWEKVKPR